MIKWVMSSSQVNNRVTDFLCMMQFERGVSHNTIDSYGRDLEKFFSFFKKALDRITQEDVLKYFRAMSSSAPSTRSRHISCLRQFFAFLVREGVIKANVMEGVKTSSPRLIPKTLEENSMSKLLAAAASAKGERGTRTLCMVELLYSTGMRVSELVSLPYPLPFVGNMIRVTGKGDKERLVCINGRALAALEKYIGVRGFFDPQGKSRWLFPSKSEKGHMTRHRVFQIIKDLSQAAGLGYISPHTIRHTTATHLLEGGADLVSIRDLLGHASVDTTQIYTHVNIKRKLEVVEKFHPLGISRTLREGI